MPVVPFSIVNLVFYQPHPVTLTSDDK
jgi:hypothetical protein